MTGESFTIGECYKSAYFSVDLSSDGTITAKIPVTPEETASVRFIATIHGQQFYSEWFTFEVPAQDVYSTIRISSSYQSSTGFYYDNLECIGKWASHSATATDGKVQSIVIDGIEIQGVLKKNTKRARGIIMN